MPFLKQAQENITLKTFGYKSVNSLPKMEKAREVGLYVAEGGTNGEGRRRSSGGRFCARGSIGAAANMAADTGMETCPSPEVADSRKRPLDHRADDPAEVKRSHFSSGERPGRHNPGPRRAGRNPGTPSRFRSGAERTRSRNRSRLVSGGGRPARWCSGPRRRLKVAAVIARLLCVRARSNFALVRSIALDVVGKSYRRDRSIGKTENVFRKSARKAETVDAVRPPRPQHVRALTS